MRLNKKKNVSIHPPSPSLSLSLSSTSLIHSDTRRTSYQAIAKAAYGPVGHYVAFAVVAVNLFGCAVLYTILPATLMEDMLATYAHVRVPTFALVTVCSTFVWACLICTKTMKEVTWLSILGAAATIGVVCITVGVSTADLVTKAAEITATHKLVDWSKIPLSLATISFAYSGNVVYPHMEASMARPRSWARALWCALSFCFGMYMIIAMVGYLAFGAETQSPVLKNLPNGKKKKKKRLLKSFLLVTLETSPSFPRIINR